ncbi:hypothetical protein AAG570_004066 [Ranatra chinensis]|uniref:Uncharacterized protein n=1 Tax=Ranatra chinensis TaxID=642074 RepID=A0ABD0Y2Q9_9HEMI
MLIVPLSPAKKEAMGGFEGAKRNQGSPAPRPPDPQQGKRLQIMSPFPSLSDTMRNLTISDNVKELSTSPPSELSAVPRVLPPNVPLSDTSDVSSDSASDSENEDDVELIAKCPDKLKDQKKNSRPKPYSAKDSFNSSGGIVYSQQSVPSSVYAATRVDSLNIPLDAEATNSYPVASGVCQVPACTPVVPNYFQSTGNTHLNIPCHVSAISQPREAYLTSGTSASAVKPVVNTGFYESSNTSTFNISCDDHYQTQIPETVEEFSRKCLTENSDQSSVEKRFEQELFSQIKQLNEEQQESLEKAIRAILEDDVDSTPAARPKDDPQDVYSKPWKSVDSNYGTLSPGSSVTLSPGGAVSPSYRRQHASSIDSDRGSICSTPSPFEPEESASVRIAKPVEEIFNILGDSPLSQIPPPVPYRPALQVRQPTLVLPSVRPEYSPTTPSLVMATSGIERYKKTLDKKVLEIVWIKACLSNNIQADMITKALRSPPNAPGYAENIFALVELARKKNLAEALLGPPEMPGPLYVAALELPKSPLIARLIADTIITLKESPDKVYDSNGNNLLHIIAKYGDSHAGVLAELLHVKQPSEGSRGGSVPGFNVDKKNLMDETPLHVAVRAHINSNNCSRTISTINITKLLRDHGAGLHFQVCHL